MQQPIFTPIYVDTMLVDIRATCGDRHITMLGTGGAEREKAIVIDDVQNKLPVLLGAGLGHALQHILHSSTGPVAVVDKEHALTELTGLRHTISPEHSARILWLTDDTPATVITALSAWQAQHGGLPFAPMAHPFYLRIDNAYYAALRHTLTATTRLDFWGKARQPRFCTPKPRLLLITSQYFLMGEVIGACTRLDIPHHLLTLKDDCLAQSEFVQQLLHAVIEFRPDAVLTLNHMGVDKEGVLIDLLEKLQLPLASWFVDNPHLILHCYHKLVSPWTSIFTWDADNIASLTAMGFEHVFYLPLATDTQRFCPQKGKGYTAWKARVSFVGNSMVYKVGARFKAAKPPKPLLVPFKEMAAHFDAHEARSVPHFLQQYYPTLYEVYAALPNNERRLAYETALIWEATRQYRARCVQATLPFAPLIVGDTGWRTIFRDTVPQPRYHKELNYYLELPHFYPHSEINFNCTSKQMKGAVNQRIFDVPATGAFVLTDWREQMDALFEPRTECISYTNYTEIPELIRYYLNHPTERQRIVTAARRRVLAEHTWQHRLQTLLTHMREVYATPPQTQTAPTKSTL